MCIYAYVCMYVRVCNPVPVVLCTTRSYVCMYIRVCIVCMYVFVYICIYIYGGGILNIPEVHILTPNLVPSICVCVFMFA